MIQSKIKDKILRTVLKGRIHSDELAKKLNVPLHSIHVLCKEITADGNMISFHVEDANLYILIPNEQGRHFAENTSYRKQAFWKDVQELPKKYWFIIAFVGSLGFNVKDLIEYFETRSKEKRKIEQKQQFLQPQPIQKDTL